MANIVKYSFAIKDYKCFYSGRIHLICIENIHILLLCTIEPSLFTLSLTLELLVRADAVHQLEEPSHIEPEARSGHNNNVLQTEANVNTTNSAFISRSK